MLKYFDLNSKVQKDLAPVTKTFSMESMPESVSKGEGKLSVQRQLLMYFGLLVGVLFSTAINQFKKGEAANLNIDPTTVIISAIIALMLVPMVYKNLRVDSKAPFIVQFGLFVQNGVFWNIIVDSLGKVIK